MCAAADPVRKAKMLKKPSHQTCPCISLTGSGYKATLPCMRGWDVKIQNDPEWPRPISRQCLCWAYGHVEKAWSLLAKKQQLVGTR